MLRGGLIGAGHVALHGHVPGWRARADARIVATADPRPEARASVAALLPGIAVHDDASALVDSGGIDFLDICTPPSFHASAIRLGLERGLHVLCEKPLVLDPGELSDLADLARSRRLVLASVHNWRHAPLLAAATRLVREGAIGRVRACRWEVLRERPSVAAAAPAAPAAGNWRLDPEVAGGGILVDHGWHAVYTIASWMPGRMSTVSARLSTIRHLEAAVEDTADVVLGFEGGEARIFLTWAADERKNRVAIEGERGTITIDGGTLSRRTAEISETMEFPESLSEGSHHAAWFAGVASEFLDAVGSPARSAPSLAEAAVCAEAIRLAQDSSRVGGRVMPVRALATSTATASASASLETRGPA